jgi:arylsulfatase A-like enzyme
MPKLSRRGLLAGAPGVALGVAAGCEGGGRASGGDDDDNVTRPPTQPNIVYIYVDQLRYDALGCCGNPVARTPNLDELAREAVSFSHCITNGPSCRAARATMITGLHVYAHKVWDNYIAPDPRLQSHVRRMRDEAGYHAMVIGKTHLHDGTGHFDDHKDKLVAFGFSDAIELPDPQQWNYESAHSDWLTATTPAGASDKYERWQQYILQYQWDSPPPDAEPFALATDDHLDRFCGRTAADFVRAWISGEQPLYLQVCFPGPHKPFDPTSEYLAEIDPDDPTMPLPVLEPPEPPIAPLVQDVLLEKGETWTEQGARALRQHYFAKIALIDDAIGDVLAALREAGLYDDAWVIVHSDHGELAADHTMTGKRLAYEGSIRVPLLVKPPAGAAAWLGGWTDRGQVDQMDVTATILAMAGLDPTGYGERDLVPRILAGPSSPDAHASKPVLYENLGMVGVRDGRFKVAWDLESGLPVELYDLEADPDERTNRVLDPALREELRAMVDTLRALRPLPVDRWQP